MPYCSACDAPGPTYKVQAVDLSYPGRYRSISLVDFQNLALPEWNALGKRTGSIPLEGGRYHTDGPQQHFEEHLDSVHYLHSSCNSQFALALYSWFSARGSSSQGSEAFVFLLAKGQLRCRQVIRWDTHFAAGEATEVFYPNAGLLLIRSAHYLPGDAHCCVSAMDVVTFRWTHRQFVESDFRTQLSR